MIGKKIKENEDVKPNSRELNKLKAEFPQFFTNKGKFKIDIFKEFLTDEDISFAKEGYELKFLGKSYARYLSSVESETFIAPNREHNEKEENKNSENLYIVGDNIDALKHLLKSYSGQIKCIYIDPPYNTGSDGFVYPDNFQFDKDKLADTIGITEEEARRILDLAGKSTHSAWLTFMYPRLLLARELLTEDGVIFISIDDNEEANLKLICDEIFGEQNALKKITWESKTKSQNTKTARNKLQPKTESILVYKNQENPYNFELDITSTKNYDEKDEKGVFRYYRIEEMSNLGIRARETMVFPILGVLPNEDKQWKLGRDSIKNYENRGDLILVDNVPYIKMRPSDEDTNSYKPFWSHFFESEIYGTAESAKQELNDLLGHKEIFDTVKPVSLIMTLIKRMGGIKQDKSFIILDFFSGSSTSAHATMKLNAEDGGNRKYIMVQIPEKIEKNKPAYKEGYRTIDAIGRDRIKQVSERIKKDTGANIDYGFKVFHLEKPIGKTLKDLVAFEPETKLISEDMITVFENKYATGKQSILSTWMNEDGYGLSRATKSYKLDTYEAELIEKTLYLIEEGLKSQDIIELVKRIEKNILDINRVVIYIYSIEFHILQELRKNLKVLRNNINVKLIERY